MSPLQTIEKLGVGSTLGGKLIAKFTGANA